MIGQITANIRTNLKFYRRNRLLLIVALLLLVIFGLFSIPSMIFITDSKKFAIVQSFFTSMNLFVLVFTAALGLVNISHHIRERCVKMVITRPCTVDTWLLSSFLSAALVGFALFMGVLAVSMFLFLAWELPVQWGFAYQSFNHFFEALIILSYISFLSVVLHPFTAAIVALLFNDGLFADLLTWLIAALEKVGPGLKGIALQAVEFVFYFLYLVLPSYSPFGDKMKAVSITYRVSLPEMKYLLYTAAYAVVLSVFFLAISSYAMRRKRLI